MIVVIATRAGSLILANLIKETRYSWHLSALDNNNNVRISKKDEDCKVFSDVDVAISWIKA